MYGYIEKNDDSFVSLFVCLLLLHSIVTSSLSSLLSTQYNVVTSTSPVVLKTT